MAQYFAGEGLLSLEPDLDGQIVPLCQAFHEPGSRCGLKSEQLYAPLSRGIRRSISENGSLGLRHRLRGLQVEA